MSPVATSGVMVTAVTVATMLIATAIGWGLVTNSAAHWLTWQGYLLEPLGLGGKEGTWAFANLGVLFALVAAFLVQLFAGRSQVHQQEQGQARDQLSSQEV